MSNSDALVDELQQAADAGGREDLAAAGGRRPARADQVRPRRHRQLRRPLGARPLQGGAFLSHFVPRDDTVPWAHLDIAGVADTEKELPYYAQGRDRLGRADAGRVGDVADHHASSTRRRGRRGGEREMTKSETRNPNQIRMTNDEAPRFSFVIRASSLIRHSDCPAASSRRHSISPHARNLPHPPRRRDHARGGGFVAAAGDAPLAAAVRHPRAGHGGGGTVLLFHA